MTDHPDTLFQRPSHEVGGFRFDEQVAQVFPDMIRRSVPGYGQVIGLSALIAKRYAQPHTCLYDLGCSLGATTLAMAEQVTEPGCRIIAMDDSKAMLERARSLATDRLIDPLPIDWVQADIADCAFEPASVMAMNFTLQFIDPSRRADLVGRIYDALNPGGVLFMAEKVEHASSFAQSTLTDLHRDFKRANGYSELEIANKRQAIETVLISDTSETHLHRLHAAGFSDVVECFHCLNFKAWLAVK
jgi:tRNA (cmo5U34)-methyltransferase